MQSQHNHSLLMQPQQTNFLALRTGHNQPFMSMANVCALKQNCGGRPALVKTLCCKQHSHFDPSERGFCTSNQFQMVHLSTMFQIDLHVFLSCHVNEGTHVAAVDVHFFAPWMCAFFGWLKPSLKTASSEGSSLRASKEERHH